MPMPMVVRSVRFGESKVDEEDKGRYYYRVDFTMIDLDTGDVCPEFRPSLYSCMGLGNMVKLGEDPAATLYLIGGSLTPFDMSEKLLKLKEEKRPGYYMGACRVSASASACLNGGGDWQHLDPPNTQANYMGLPGSLAALMGRIYCFGYPGLSPEVYDPMLDKWDHLSIPPELELEVSNSDSELMISPPVVPDPQNNRILIHLSSGHLYSFCPTPSSEEGAWSCLSQKFYDWPEVATVVDSVLYFYDCQLSSLLCAYDLTTGKWLHVLWSAIKIDGVYLGSYQFSAMFSVGKGVLCLAHLGAPVNLFKVTVERTSPSALLLTPISFKSFPLPPARRVPDILPLKDVF